MTFTVGDRPKSQPYQLKWKIKMENNDQLPYILDQVSDEIYVNVVL